MGLDTGADVLQQHMSQNEPAKQAKQEDIVYNQWATFKVNNELYGIDVIKVKEVLRYSEMTPVPGSESYIQGIINLRGNVVTVIDTRELFALDARAADDDTRIIVVEYNEQEVVGLVVDSVDEVINLPTGELERAPSVSSDESTRRFVQGVCYYNGLLVIMLDLGKIMVTITPEHAEDLNS